MFVAAMAQELSSLDEYFLTQLASGNLLEVNNENSVSSSPS